MNPDFSHPYHINHFLLVVTEPISKYLEKPFFLKIELDMSPLYCNWVNPHNKQNEAGSYDILFQKTETVLDSVNYILGCDCEQCDKPFPIYDAEIRQILQEYIPLLVSVWNAQAFETQLKNAVQEFDQDYSFWAAKFHNGECNIEAFEQQLMVWKDAIPDELLINALLSIRFDFINHALLKTEHPE